MQEKQLNQRRKYMMSQWVIWCSLPTLLLSLGFMLGSSNNKEKEEKQNLDIKKDIEK